MRCIIAASAVSTWLTASGSFAAGKTAHDLGGSRKLIQDPGNKAYFDYQIGSSDTPPSDLGEEIPVAGARDALISALLGQPARDVPEGVRVGSVAYPAMTETCIGWAVAPGDERRPPRLSVGLIRCDARHGIQPGQWVVEPTRDLPLGEREEPLRFDFAAFQLGRLGRAFGLRTVTHGCGAGGSLCSATNLLLFVPIRGRLAKVFDARMSYFGNLAGDWHDDGTRDHTVVEQEAIVRITGKRSAKDPPPTIEKVVRGKRAVQRWRWRGRGGISEEAQTYLAKDAVPGWYVTDDPELLDSVDDDDSPNRPAFRFAPIRPVADLQARVLPVQGKDGILLRSPARFDGIVGHDGLRLRFVDGSDDELGLRFLGYGRETNTNGLAAGPATSTVDTKTRTVKVARPGLTQEIWATADRLEQRFLVEKPPTGQRPGGVRFTVTAVAGKRTGQSACLSTSIAIDLIRRLSVHGLRARDAHGHPVAADLASTNDGVAIFLQDDGATYPLRIEWTIFDRRWHGVGGVWGVGGVVKAAVVGAERELYVGGRFEYAGEVLAQNVALWNGRAWSSVGAGMEGEVVALARDGLGRIYAAENVLEPRSSMTEGRVRVWNGSTWSTLGSASPPLADLAVDGAGVVYRALGCRSSYSFTGKEPPQVSMWTGNDWTELAAGWGELCRPVLAVENRARLYAAGEAKRTDRSNAFAWDGHGWSALGSGTDGRVTSLAFDRAGRLHAGVAFRQTDGQPARGVAVWEGGQWRSGSIGLDGFVARLLPDGAGGFYASARLRAHETSFDTVARWDGASWTELPRWATSEEALAVDDRGGLYVASEPGGVTEMRRWDGHRWNRLSNSPSWSPSFLAVGKAGELFVATKDTGAVAGWDGTRWVDLSAPFERLDAMAIDARGHLVAAGHFPPKGDARSGVFTWNGNAWSPLALGDWHVVRAFATDTGGNLYVGGDFDRLGGVEAKGIARWDGSSWSALGSGVQHVGLVSALAVSEASGISTLYAAGDFEKAGGSRAHNIARWDGHAWSPLGEGTPFSVSVLAVTPGGTVYAGDGAVAVAAWDGRAWSTLAPATTPKILALTTDMAGNLYAAGEAIDVGGELATGGVPPENARTVGLIARWVDGAWVPLATFGPTNDSVTALAFDGSGTLYAAGGFTTQDGRPLGHVARLGTSQLDCRQHPAGVRR